MVDEIQFMTGWTREEVAKSIGYSRVHLQKEMKKPQSLHFEELASKKIQQLKQNVSSESAQQDPYKDKYIALLEQQIGVLNQAIQSNLTALSHGQEYLSAYVKAAVTRDAERFVKDDPRKKEEEMNKIDRIFLQIVEGKQTGTPAGIQGKG